MKAATEMNEVCPFCNGGQYKKLIGDWCRCLDCDLGYKTSRYAPDDVAQSSEDRKAVWLDSLKGIYNQSLDAIEKELGHRGKLLDIGCGHGYFMRMAIERGWETEGNDVSKPAIKQARDIYGLKVFDKPLEQLELAPNSYDVVTLWRVIDLLNDPMETLRIVNKILKPGGLLFLRVNNFSFHYPVFKLNKLSLFKKFNIQPAVLHRYGVNSKSLATALKNSGYKEVGIWNSRLTPGDSSGSGGILGKVPVVVAKTILSFFWGVVSVLSFKKLLWASALMASAKKAD